VEVVSVNEKDLPPIDDELAAKVGEFDDLEALRKQIALRLGHEKRRALDARREEAVLEQLRQRHPLELPEGVVEEETRDMLGEYAQNLSRQGIDVEKVKLDWNRLAEEVKPQAVERVHTRLVLDAVGEARGVEVAADEVEQRVAALARAQNQSAAQLRRTLVQNGRLAGLEVQMRREKTLLALLGEDTVETSAGESADGSEEE